MTETTYIATANSFSWNQKHVQESMKQRNSFIKIILKPNKLFKPTLNFSLNIFANKS